MQERSDDHPEPEVSGRPARAGADKRKPGGLAVTALSLVVLAVLAVPALAHINPGADYQIDLVANLAAQACLVTLLAAGAWLLLRRRGFALAAVVVVCAHLLALSMGRASIGPLPQVAASMGRDERVASGVIRIYHHNASREQVSPELADDIDAWGPDIVHITEPSGFVLQMRSRMFGDEPGGERRTWVINRVAHWARRVPDGEQTLIGDAVLASRWPMEVFDPLPEGAWRLPESWARLTVLAAKVHAPSPIGDFVVIAIHPQSPRSLERWLVGNGTVEEAIRIAGLAEREGLPVVLVGDLNSTPTGHRSRELARAGLNRAKPLMRLEPTWPTKAGVEGAMKRLVGFWPAGLAIDDACASEEWSVRAWSRGDSRGSDHWPVIIDLALERPAGAEPAGGTAAP